MSDASSDSYARLRSSARRPSSKWPTAGSVSFSCARRARVACCRPRAAAPPGGMYVDWSQLSTAFSAFRSFTSNSRVLNSSIVLVTDGLLDRLRLQWTSLYGRAVRARAPGESMSQDVPSPVDFRQMTDAVEWESTALAKRPWRTEIFEAFARELANARPAVQRVLELGSGPGFLAKHLLDALPDIYCTLLDFSGAMHLLARQRLGALTSRVQFVERSFKEAGWNDGLGVFDAVVTNQAVHELRHKRHATRLHAGVHATLGPQGRYLVCDHFAGKGGMRDENLYMTVAEQRQALHDAGFSRVEQIILRDSLVMHRAQI